MAKYISVVFEWPGTIQQCYNGPAQFSCVTISQLNPLHQAVSLSAEQVFPNNALSLAGVQYSTLQCAVQHTAESSIQYSTV